MKIKYLFILGVLLCTTITFSQNLDSSLTSISNEFNDVTTKTTNIERSIKEISSSIIQYTEITTQIKNGKSITEQYIFNPADIDLNTVKSVTNKDVIVVQLLVKNKQQLIKKIVDFNTTSYVNSISINCNDVNNSRIIVESIKKIIPIATQITDNRLSLKTYEEHMNWLIANIGDVAVADKNYTQKIELNTKYKGRLVFNLIEGSAKTLKKSLYEFNAMNINPNSILFKVNGGLFSLEIQTKRKLDLVKYFVNDEQKNFTDKFEIYCTSVEHARDIQKVLRELIILSESEFNKQMVVFNSSKQAFDFINSIIARVSVNDVTFTQNLTSDCVTKMSITEADASKSLASEFTFNFSDINKNTISYEAKKQFLFLNLQTLAKNDFIKVEEEKELKNYKRSLQIAVSEIEESILLESAFKYIVEKCESEIVSYKNKSTTELINLLIANIKTINVGAKSLDQSLEKGMSENGLKFKILEIAEKSTKEKLFEFNYTDINPGSIKFEASGKNVNVLFGTKFNEKIFQYYEDGQIKNYQNTISISAESIENARTITSLIKAMVEKK